MAKLKTGRHTSAIKELRKAKKRETDNTSVNSKIRTLSNKVETAVKAKNKTEALKLYAQAASAWDKASKKGVVHKNSANNQKARLLKLVNTVK